MTSDAFTIEGSRGQAIVGNTHLPTGMPRGVVVIAHGFKGYKDYGMFPYLAEQCAAAGFIAHRFNFSHSGMTNEIETFTRPDLFENDTWSRQVEDLEAIVQAIGNGKIAGNENPLVLFGHSRGGVAVCLFAGRVAKQGGKVPNLRGVVTAAAPATCNSLSPELVDVLMEQGYLESPSSRTGQVLRVGREFLAEQLDSPEDHDLTGLVGRIRRPMLFIHGDDDPTVPVESCTRLQKAAIASPDAKHLIIAGANHVFNTTNPMSQVEQKSPSPQLSALVEGVVNFANRVCDA